MTPDRVGHASCADELLAVDDDLAGVLCRERVPILAASRPVELRESFGVWERVTTRVPVMGESLWPKITSDDMASYGAEASSITETDSTYANITLKPKRLATLTRVNNELMSSTPVAIANHISNEFGRRFAGRLDNVAFEGAGSAAQGGILGATTQLEANTSLVGNQAAAGNTNAAVTLANLHTLSGLLPQYAAPGAMWFAHRETVENVFGRLSMASGGVTKAETALGTLPTFMGYPIVTVQKMPQASGSTYTSADIFILLGDFRIGSYFGVNDDMRFEMSSERYFDTNQTGIRGVMYCDQNIHDIGTTSVAGSIVGLRST